MYIVKNLTHSSTITGELLVALKTKTSLLIAPTVMPPRYIFHNIYKYKVSIIGVNPSLLSMYALEYRNKNYDISSLKKVYVSGSILSDKLYEIAHMTFINQKIYNVYGLSEAAPRVSAQRKDCCKSNSVGTPIKGVSVAIINEFGEKASVGQYGIIYVDSPSIFNGYITGELKHKSVYHGWLNTGDVGYFDKYGELHIVERIDDMIIIGAHKIYPSEIENKICSIGNIQECLIAKIKIRDEDKLCCLYSSKNDIQSDIINILGKVLMKHEIPKKFVKIVSLPRTQNGKISRQLAKKILYKELSKENCL